MLRRLPLFLLLCSVTALVSSDPAFTVNLDSSYVRFEPAKPAN